MMKPQAIILDLDGTLFDDSARRHLLDDKKFDEYHAELSLDPINVFVKAITNNLCMNYGYDIIIVTTRPIKYEKETKKQLLKANVLNKGLFMRQEGDDRTSPEIKADIIDALLTKYNIVGALDDRDDVIQEYQKRNIFSLKPIKGHN
jgi:FMN phosphatase YigB (HAD superfamily)